MGYRYNETFGVEPEFCFGHGFSYTEFIYEDAVYGEEAEGGYVICRLTNAGQYAGAETIQVYRMGSCDKEAADSMGESVDITMLRPAKELVGFGKIYLEPGESGQVKIAVKENGVHETTEFLELFLRNLLLGERHELHNRAMHISGMFAEYTKADIEAKKADIGQEKADIEVEKKDIETLKEYENLLLSFSAKNIMYARKLYESFGKDSIFGRTDVQAVTGLKHTRTSELLKILAEAKVLEPVAGHGKGKYRFAQYNCAGDMWRGTR